MYFDDVFIIDTLAKKVREARETNDLKKQKILKGFSKLLSIFKTIYLIMKDYDDSEEFDEIKPFYSYIAQILCSYLENRQIRLTRPRLSRDLNWVKQQTHVLVVYLA